MGNTFYFNWEVSFIVWLQNTFGTAGAAIAKVLTFLAEPTAVVVVFAILYWAVSKRVGKKLGMLMLSSLVLNCMIKNVVVRRRPYFDNPEITCLQNPSAEGGETFDVVKQGFSFPSAHSMNSMSMFYVLSQETAKKVLKGLCAAAVILIGLSRNMLGVHYPTDILAGWAVTALLIAVFGKLGKNVKSSYIYTGMAFIGLIGIFYCRTQDYFSSLGLLLGFCSGCWFEERYVNFRDASSLKQGVIRIVVGIALVGVLYVGTKLLLPSSLTEGTTLLPLLVRTIRYAVLIFTAAGPYPMLFRKFEK